MKRFSFRLDRVLDVRRRQEEQAQQVLAEARRERNQSQDRLDECEQALEENTAQFQTQVQNGFSAQEALLHSNFCDRLRTEAWAEQEVLAECENQVEARREELVTALQKKKILETLREHKRSEHLTITRREEQKELDDQASRQNHRERKKLTHD
ncbi:MAG: flagellar export protein FliJ [Calditrichota bacterium]